MADDLLQMFQSITTSDHDELVDQFAHLLQLDVQTATFFLESCNWNVETAVNNYLVTVEAAGGGHNAATRDASEDLSMEDEGEGAPRLSRKTNQLHVESILYQAQCTSDLSALQNTLLAPETPVQMHWSFVNTGHEAWPTDTRLVFAQGTSFQGPEQMTVAPAVVGQRVDLHAPLCMPSEPGSYAGSWRLHCSRGFFGDPVWVVVNIGTHEAAAAFALQHQQTTGAPATAGSSDPSKFQLTDDDLQPSSTAVEDMDL
uniref:Nbr1 FW domain-containing protein n=1 Tax=Peronospora matthiolae TaxID=2874970 RepID=A0AAV1TAU6_9STRA